MSAGATTHRRVWLDSLSFLADEIADAFAPMLDRIALLIDTSAAEQTGPGEPNGYNGITNRGTLDKVLLSEWLYAIEEPDEFMRRFVNSELSFLEPQFVQPTATARFEVLVDSGPDCLGASRLAHLLALTVLAQRADQLGMDLVIGVLGTEPGQFIEGTFADQFRTWLKMRTTFSLERAETTEVVDEWAAVGETNAHRWILTGNISAAHQGTIPPGVQLLRTHIDDWNENGPASIHVELGRRSVTLPLTEPVHAIRVLRGNGLKAKNVERQTPTKPTGELRFPRFSGHAQRLLMRGEQPHIVTSLTVSGKNLGRQFRFKGPVVAAGAIGSRIVGAVIIDNELRVQSLGKDLGRVHKIAIPISDLPFDPWAQIENDLPMMLYRDAVLLKIDTKWFSIDGNRIDELGALAMAPTEQTDAPRQAYQFQNSLFVDGQSITPTPPGLTASLVFLGADRSVAAFGEGGWSVAHRSKRDVIEVEPEDTVIGVTVIHDVVNLITQSMTGHIFRLYSAEKTTTVTAASGWVSDFSVHQTAPLLAVQRNDGKVDVVDLRIGTVVASITSVSDKQHADPTEIAVRLP
jgi:hypothetical protein